MSKAKGRRSAKNKKLGRDGAKRQTTRNNKMRRLARHLKTHGEDSSASKALKRWKENPPNTKSGIS